MASSKAVTLVFVLAMAAAGCAHAAAHFTEVRTHRMRTLKQGPEQCACLKPQFTCTRAQSQPIYCLAGSFVTPKDAAGCLDPTIPNNPGCSTIGQGAGDPVPCPGHNGITAMSVCADGIPVGPGDPTPCNVCYNYTLIGTCDQRGATARSTITCAAPSITSCPAGGFITVDQFLCTATPGGTQFYFGTLGDVTKVKIPCASIMATNRCQYTIGVNNVYGCKSYNAASQATVTIGVGNIARNGCPQPVNL